MKAGIYLGKENIEIRDIEKPVCGDNDVLIKNVCSSICGTDVAVFKHGPKTGHRINAGDEFGHETTSIVVEVGKNIKDFKIGDRVYPYPLYARDNTKRAGTLGGFSEYILCPNAKLNHSLYKLGNDIDNLEACLIEPFTVGGHAAKSLDYSRDKNIAVFGSGTIGIAAGIMAKFKGANKVMIVDISDFRLNIVKELGFETCNIQKEDFIQKAIEYYGSARSLKGITADIDGYIDAAGAESVFDLFMEHGKIDASYVMVAVNNKPREINMVPIVYASQRIIGSGGYRPDDVKDVMDIMKSKKWNIKSIITQKYSIDELPDAVKKAGDINSALNVVIEFN